jgi:predicted nucleic acid-binding protein
LKITSNEFGGDTLRLYLDVCCYNRPFDDLTQLRVRLEAEAILAILCLVNERNWTLVSSDVVDLELSNMKNSAKLNKVIELCRLAHEKVTVTEAIAARADELQTFGVKALDSFHIAVAETSSVDILLSTDDELLKLTNRLSLSIRVANPLEFLPEVL